MTVLTDIANALNDYPAVETTIQIVEVALQSGTQPVINVGETWKFKVKVTNNGHINMTNVSLLITGLNGTTVSQFPDRDFDGDMTVGNLTVDGGDGTGTTGFFYFKAPSTPKPAGTGLVKANIYAWNMNLDHYATNHTKNDGVTVDYPRVTYAAQVFP